MNNKQLAIVLDYAFGQDVQALAERERLSHQRVYQILTRAASSIGKHTTQLRQDPEWAKVLLLNTRSRAPHVEKAETPEAFFFEMLAEPKTRSYGAAQDRPRDFSEPLGVDPEELELWDADPTCKHDVRPAPGGGVKCSKCPGWFCY